MNETFIVYIASLDFRQELQNLIQFLMSIGAPFKDREFETAKKLFSDGGGGVHTKIKYCLYLILYFVHL